MPILIDRYYEIVTEESAADGEAAEREILSECESVTFRELVDYLKFGELVDYLKFGEPSQYPVSDPARCWVTQDQGETRAWFERGEREYHSIHFARENPARNLKYWRAALYAAGIKGA